MHRNRPQQFHTAQRFVDIYIFGGPKAPRRPTAQERIATARLRIKERTTPNNVLHKLQIVINLRTELAETFRNLVQDEYHSPALDELRQSMQRHEHRLAHELELRKILDPPRAKTNPRAYEFRLPAVSDQRLQLEDNEESNQEAPETVEVTTSTEDSLGRSTDATDNEDTLLLLLEDVSDMMDLILACQEDIMTGNLNIAAGQTVCETAWSQIEAYEAELQLVGGVALAKEIPHKLRIKRLKGLPSAMSIVKEFKQGVLRSTEALNIDAALRLIPEHRTAVPPLFESIYTNLKDCSSSKPSKPARLILYIGILLVRDTANLWTAQSCSDLRTSLQQTRNQARVLVGRFLQKVSRPGTSNIPSQRLGVHKLMGFLESWDRMPADLHPWWYSFWIMTILTPLSPLCLAGAADPIVVEFLHVYLIVRGDFRNPSLDSFCETESLSFPAGIYSDFEELEASYYNNVKQPVAKILAWRRADRPHETADALLHRQCHIGEELMQTLERIAEEKTKPDDITDCDILDALKVKLVNDLDIFPNAMDLSYTLREVMKDQPKIASIEGLRQLMDTFNREWAGFSRVIRSPKLGESMIFSWEEFLKTDKPTYDSLFSIVASVSQGILKSVQSAQNIPSTAFPLQPDGVKLLWKMLMVKASGSIDNLSCYLEELGLLTQNSPFLMAAAIRDFLAAIYSWIPPTHHQFHHFRDIFCDRPSKLQLDNSVNSVEKMVIEVQKARIDISQYMQSQHRTSNPFAESPSRNLATASIEFLKDCLADGSFDAEHASAIDNTTKIISKCFGVEDRESTGRSNLLDIFTTHEKHRAQTLNSQGNSSMKVAEFLVAIGYYTEALQLDPENPRFLCNRSIAYSKTGHKTSANVDAKAAVRAHPSDARAHSQLGYTECWLGNPEGSLEAYEQAIKLYGSNSYHDVEKGRRKAMKGLAKAEEWCARIKGADADRGAERVHELKSTSLQPGGLCVAIELPIGFYWRRESSCGGRLVEKIPKGEPAIITITCDTQSSPPKYFYADYTTSKDVLHCFLNWLSFTRPAFYPPIKLLKFDTSQNILNTDRLKASQIIEEVLRSSVISKDCSVFVDSTLHGTIEIPRGPSHLFGLSKIFCMTGIQLLKENDCDGALESFYSAVSALEDINPPIRSLIFESVECRSHVLQTHIKTANYKILEKFVSDSYTLAKVPWHQNFKLDDHEIKKLQGCMIRCAEINKGWDNLSRAKEFTAETTKLYGPYMPAQVLLSRLEEMLQWRKQGHFPKLKSLEYGKMTGASKDLCSLCRKHLVVGDDFNLVRKCSHLFHHYCMSNSLSTQFNDAPRQFMLATAVGGNITLELKCPSCSGKIDYSSMQQGHFIEWREGLQSS